MERKMKKTTGIAKTRKKIRWKKVIATYLMFLPAMIYFIINNYKQWTTKQLAMPN